MRESVPDLTEEAVEIPDEPRPEPPKPPPPPPQRRVSLLDFGAVAAAHPPSVRFAAPQYYRRPMWAGRISWLRTPAGDVIYDGVPPYVAYATSALVGVVLAVALYLGIM